MSSEHHRTLAPTAASAGEARRFVDAVLVAAHLDALSYSATLMVSELVANAILHTTTPVELVVTVDDTSARVEVHDGSPQLPVRKHYSTMSGTGRGLMMVDRMASRWGAEPTPTGKSVWFEVDARSMPLINFLEADAL
jgi:anti-sigma regulatory factor (Ser/Thr protein kinase)